MNEEKTLASTADITAGDITETPAAAAVENHKSGEKEEEKGKKDDDEEEEGWLGSLLFLAVIGVAIWALIHFNPSESDHRKAIAEDIADSYLEAAVMGYSLDVSAIARLKYGSLGVCSWTYTTRGGRFQIASVGACGYVHSFAY